MGRVQRQAVKRVCRQAQGAPERLVEITVVCIGAKTAGRKYINYEIAQSLKRGNGLVGIQINQLKDKDGNVDPVGKTPPQIENAGFKVYKYVDHEKLAVRIEEAAKLAGK